MRFFLIGYRWIGVLFVALGVVLGQSTISTAAPQLTLGWSDTSTNEDGFKIERKTGTTGTYGQITQVGANTTSFLDTAVTAGTTYCYRVRSFNSAGNSAYSNEACGTPSVSSQSFTLSVTKTGTGTGTILSSPAGINCGTICSSSYTSGTSVTLSATASSGSTFSGWSGGGCSGTGTCTILTNTNISVTATFTSNTPPPPPPTNPVVAYGFNEGSGTTVADASGNNRTGTIAGATWTTAGKYGAALVFNGGTAQVTSGLTTHAMVRSYALWSLRTDGGGGSLGRILDKRSSTGTEVELLYNDERVHVYRYIRAWSGGIGSWSIPQPSANVWHHIAVVYDATSTANNPQIYVDGVAQTVTRVSAPSGSPLTNTDAYVLGNRGAGDRGWSGTLDDLRIYDRTLTSSEIQSLMTTPIGTLPTYTLTITKSGTGTGTVNSSPTGISCGTSCASAFTSGTVVTLSAAPAAGSTFSGWSGANDCSDGKVTVSAAITCTATFTNASSAGLAVAYGFNEGSGTTVTDASGNNRNGTIAGATWTTAGKYGAALVFNGGTAKVTSGLTTHATVRSYSLWSLRTGDGGSGLGRLFDKRTTGSEVELLMSNAATNTYTYERAWSGGIARWSIPRPSANVWHHIVVIYDASSVANNPQIYVDGVAQTVIRVVAPSGSALTNTDAYVLGNRGAGDRGWNGQLDNFRTYDRALTAAEIATDMATAVTP